MAPKSNHNEILTVLKSEEYQQILKSQIESANEKLWTKMEGKMEELFAKQKEEMDQMLNANKVEIEDLKKRLDTVELQLLQKDSHIEELKLDIDDCEQYSRRNCLIVSGLPKIKENDNTDGIFMNLVNTMELNQKLSLKDIDRSHKIGKDKDIKTDDGTVTTSTMIVKFTNYNARKVFYDERKSTKKDKKIFISESLTTRRSELMFKCRQLKREGKIKGCWTNDGNIRIKPLIGVNVSIFNQHDINYYQNN